MGAYILAENYHTAVNENAFDYPEKRGVIHIFREAVNYAGGEPERDNEYSGNARPDEYTRFDGFLAPFRRTLVLVAPRREQEAEEREEEVGVPAFHKRDEQCRSRAGDDSYEEEENSGFSVFSLKYETSPP